MIMLYTETRPTMRMAAREFKRPKSRMFRYEGIMPPEKYMVTMK